MAKKKVVVKKKKVVKKAAAAPKVELPAVKEGFDLMTVNLSKFGYELPDNLKAQQRMLAAKIDAGDDAEKHAAVILAKMKQDEVHLKFGIPVFIDFCNEKLNLATGTTTNALKLVEHFSEMGFDPKFFKKITPSHVHIIYRGFKDGAIAGKKLQAFLAMSDPSSGEYKNREGLLKEVHKELGIDAGKTGERTKNYVVKPETGQAQEIIESCLGILKGHPVYGSFTASQLFEKAMQEFVANHSKDAKPSFLSADAALNMLASMLPACIAPILVVVDPAGVENMPAEMQSIAKRRLVSSVFASFKDYKKVEVLTTSIARAAKVMKVAEDSVRETPIEVDPALIPETAGRFYDGMKIEAKPELPTPETLIEMSEEQLKKLATLVGYKITRMSREKILVMLLTDSETYKLSKDDAKALISPKKLTKPAKAKAKAKVEVEDEEAEAEEETEEESPEAEESGESEESAEAKPEEESTEDDLVGSLLEGEEEVIAETEDSAREKSKVNLALLKNKGFVTQVELGQKIKEITEENPNITAFDRLLKVLDWSRVLCKKNNLESK